MAFAYIIEVADQGKADQSHRIEAPQFPWVTTQRVSYTTSTQSAAFNGKTSVVMFSAPAAVHFEVGTDPTATATSPQLAEGQWFTFGVDAGSSLKIAFYDGSS